MGGLLHLVRVRQAEDYLRYCDEKFSPTGKYTTHMEYKQSPPLPPDDPHHGAFYRGIHTRDGDGPQHWDHDTACVLGAIDMIKNRSCNQPFLCFLPLQNPHPSYQVEEDYYDAIDPDLLPPRIPTPSEEANLPQILDALRNEYWSNDITEEMWRDVKRIYYAMCFKVDRLFGKVVDALLDQGLYDDTWILFFSDHGDFTGDYSLPEKTHSTMQDCLVRVPLIIKPPIDVPTRPGNREDLAELVDVTATLYDLLDIDPGYTHQGISLGASLVGEDAAIRDAVFAEVGSRKNEEGYTFSKKQIENMPADSFCGRQCRAGIPDTDAGSHAVMCRMLQHKYIRRYYTGHHELFDLATDPGETLNLSGRQEYADIERHMEIRVLDFFMRTGDVLPHEQDLRGV